MNSNIIAALIIAAGMILSVWLWQYYSPYQTCVRQYPNSPSASWVCKG